MRLIVSARKRGIFTWLLAGLLACATLSGGHTLQAAQPGRQAGAEHAGREHQGSAASGGEQSAPDANAAEKKEEVVDESAEYRHSATVQKLGAMMGMNADQAATAFTVFNFLVLCAGVGYLLLKSLPKTFRKRTSNIQKGLVDARTATEEASARLNSVETRLGKLDAQIEAMRAQASADSVRDERRIKDAMEEERAKILAAAETEIVAATSLARRQIGRYAAELAVDQAARKLVVTADTDRVLVETFARGLGSSGSSGLGSGVDLVKGAAAGKGDVN